MPPLLPVRRRWPCGSLLLLWAVAAGSEDLSLAQLWDLARQRNLALQQQEILRRQAGEEVAIQQAERLPAFSAAVAYGYTSQVARLPFALPGGNRLEAGTRNRYDAALIAEQPLFTGGRIRQLGEAARFQARAQEAQQEVSCSQVLLQVGQLYYQIQLNQVQQQLLGQAIARAGIHLQRSRSLYQAQQATAFDTLEVANRRLQLFTQAQELADLRLILLSRLARILDLEEIPRIAAASPIEEELALEDLAQLQERARRDRPELRQMAALREAQSRRESALESALRPQVYASAAYHVGRPGVDLFRDQWMDYYLVGVNARWQAWDWEKDDRQVEKARLEGRRLELQEQQLRQEIRQQVAEASAQLQTTREQIRLQRQLVAQEQERYRLARESYEQGQATSLDLSNAENGLIAAELALEQSYVQWRQSRLQLQFAAGGLR